jgi:hypothetical protein
MEPADTLLRDAVGFGAGFTAVRHMVDAACTLLLCAAENLAAAMDDGKKERACVTNIVMLYGRR